MGSRIIPVRHIAILAIPVFFFFGSVQLVAAVGNDAQGKCTPYIEKCQCGEALEKQPDGSEKCVKRGGPEINTHNCPLHCIDTTGGHQTRGQCVDGGKCHATECNGTNGKDCVQAKCTGTNCPKDAPQGQQPASQDKGGQPPSMPSPPGGGGDQPKQGSSQPTNNATGVNNAFEQQKDSSKENDPIQTRDDPTAALRRLSGEGDTSPDTGNNSQTTQVGLNTDGVVQLSSPNQTSESDGKSPSEDPTAQTDPNGTFVRSNTESDQSENKSFAQKAWAAVENVVESAGKGIVDAAERVVAYVTGESDTEAPAPTLVNNTDTPNTEEDTSPTDEKPQTPEEQVRPADPEAAKKSVEAYNRLYDALQARNTGGPCDADCQQILEEHDAMVADANRPAAERFVGPEYKWPNEKGVEGYYGTDTYKDDIEKFSQEEDLTACPPECIRRQRAWNEYLNELPPDTTSKSMQDMWDRNAALPTAPTEPGGGGQSDQTPSTPQNPPAGSPPDQNEPATNPVRSREDVEKEIESLSPTDPKTPSRLQELDDELKALDAKEALQKRSDNADGANPTFAQQVVDGIGSAYAAAKTEIGQVWNAVFGGVSSPNEPIQTTDGKEGEGASNPNAPDEKPQNVAAQTSGPTNPDGTPFVRPTVQTELTPQQRSDAEALADNLGLKGEERQKLLDDTLKNIQNDQKNGTYKPESDYEAAEAERIQKMSPEKYLKEFGTPKIPIDTSGGLNPPSVAPPLNAPQDSTPQNVVPPANPAPVTPDYFEGMPTDPQARIDAIDQRIGNINPGDPSARAEVGALMTEREAQQNLLDQNAPTQPPRATPQSYLPGPSLEGWSVTPISFQNPSGEQPAFEPPDQWTSPTGGAPEPLTPNASQGAESGGSGEPPVAPFNEELGKELDALYQKYPSGPMTEEEWSKFQQEEEDIRGKYGESYTQRPFNDFENAKKSDTVQTLLDKIETESATREEFNTLQQQVYKEFYQKGIPVPDQLVGSYDQIFTQKPGDPPSSELYYDEKLGQWVNGKAPGYQSDQSLAAPLLVPGDAKGSGSVITDSGAPVHTEGIDTEGSKMPEYLPQNSAENPILGPSGQQLRPDLPSEYKPSLEDTYGVGPDGKVYPLKDIAQSEQNGSGGTPQAPSSETPASGQPAGNETGSENTPSEPTSFAQKVTDGFENAYAAVKDEVGNVWEGIKSASDIFSNSPSFQSPEQTLNTGDQTNVQATPLPPATSNVTPDPGSPPKLGPGTVFADDGDVIGEPDIIPPANMPTPEYTDSPAALNAQNGTPAPIPSEFEPLPGEALVVRSDGTVGPPPSLASLGNGTDVYNAAQAQQALETDLTPLDRWGEQVANPTVEPGQNNSVFFDPTPLGPPAHFEMTPLQFWTNPGFQNKPWP